jgi:putative heme-binding domain-containing protein
MLANNAQWVGFSMEIGPDGALYALDWHDADICGQEVLNSETGRIFRIAPEKSLAKEFEGRYSDLDEMNDKQLIDLQTSSSDWHSRRARGILQKRAAKGQLNPNTKAELMKLYRNNSNPDWRLRAMWALHITESFTEKELISALSDQDQHIRSWAIQLLSEDKKPSAEAMSKFRLMAVNDDSAVVRLYLSAAMQRMETKDKWEIASRLIHHQEDERDHNIPKLLWFGIEPLLEENPERFLQMSSKSKIPLVTQYMARRAVDADETEKLVALIGNENANNLDLLTGMLSGMEGRTDLQIPSNWKSIAAKLQNEGGKSRTMALEISELFGDTEATQRAFTLLKNKNAPTEQRKRALQTLAAQQRNELIKELPVLLEETELRIEAIRAIAAFDNENLGKLLIENYAGFSPEDKAETINTLSSRPRYGGLLTKEIKEKRIPKKEVPASAARQLLRVVGSGFIEVWGPIEQVPSDKAAYEKYQKLLSSQNLTTGNLKSGKTIFQKSCGACHKMFGEGGEMGPDLTGSNRSDTDYILMNVLEPSSEIQDAYKMVVINTRDGRTYSGNVVTENQRQLTLRVVGQDPVVINKSSILSREATEVSMMPPGLFENLSEKEIVDLVAYLKTNKAVN